MGIFATTKTNIDSKKLINLKENQLFSTSSVGTVSIPNAPWDGNLYLHEWLKLMGINVSVNIPVSWSIWVEKPSRACKMFFC